MFGGGEDVGHPGGLRAAFPAAENGTDDKYYKKYHAILRRCAGVQKVGGLAGVRGCGRRRAWLLGADPGE